MSFKWTKLLHIITNTKDIVWTSKIPDFWLQTFLFSCRDHFFFVILSSLAGSQCFNYNLLLSVFIKQVIIRTQKL